MTTCPCTRDDVHNHTLEEDHKELQEVGMFCIRCDDWCDRYTKPKGYVIIDGVRVIMTKEVDKAVRLYRKLEKATEDFTDYMVTLNTEQKVEFSRRTKP